MKMTNKAEKKVWSKKKKIVVAIICIIAVLFVGIIGAGIGVWNWYCDPGEYTIEAIDESMADDVTLVAHRGFRGVAPENTLPAFEKAGEAGFDAIECDTYRTTDGVWVIDHDGYLMRMMDKFKNVEKISYEELKEYNITNGIDIDSYPDLKVCTLEEYMQTCQKYGMNAVIELKGENNQEYYSEIIDIISKYPSVKVMFISFQFSDLQALRKVCDNELMYLVQKIEDDDIELAKTIDNCGIDFNGNKEKNYENNAEMIKKCQTAGLNVGAWTIDDMTVLKKLVDNGVSLITTNCITY